MWPKSSKKNNKIPKKGKIRHKSHKKCLKEVKSAKKLSIVDTFVNFLATYTNFVCRSDSVRQTIFLFVAVIQFTKLNFCLSQWLSVTNNTDKKFYLLVACDKGIGKKKPKTNILPNLNFTSAIKLLWGTIYVYCVYLCTINMCICVYYQYVYMCTINRLLLRSGVGTALNEGWAFTLSLTTAWTV